LHFSVVLEKVLYHFDSASSANDRTAKAIQDQFRLFFHQNIPVINCASPQQKNGYDCGLYVIVAVEELSRKALEYDPDGSKSDKDLLEKCTADLHRIITKDYVQQRREEYRTLVQSLSMEKKVESS
jgi:Ulp1 family protease